ncbi:MAG TPA: multicopper oxidase family protein [Prosthecobacter sp.]
MSIVRFILGIVILGHGTDSGLQAQSNALRSDVDLRMSQFIENADGTKSSPVSKALPARRTLDFTMQSAEPTAPVAGQAAADERQAMVKRLKQADEAIMACVLNSAGQPKGTTEEILTRLEAARQQAQGDLRKDLDNLLISALAKTSMALSGGAGATATFKVWSYRLLGESNPADTALCGPTIVAHPGTTLFIPVLNLLNKSDLDIANIAPLPKAISFLNPLPNAPHGFDVINLHTHGLNVSPNWPADDVFREVRPYQLKFYVYSLPADHPVGTFWYHPHKHGAASSQVAGGMAGALLVRGLKEPQGLDQLGVTKGWQSEGPPLLLQQLAPYQHASTQTPNPNDFIFRPDAFALYFIGEVQNGVNLPDIGTAVSQMTAGLGQLVPPIQSWVNGRFQPLLPERFTGDTFRLRLIHGGIAENWRFGLAKVGAAAGTQPPIIQVIAWDGLPLETPYYLDAAQPKLILSPGNRADVLVWLPDTEPGKYEVLAQPLTGTQTQIRLATFEVRAGDARAGKFLTAEEVRPYLKPDPPRPPGGAALPEFTYTGRARRMRVRGAPGNYALDKGVFFINEQSYPGTPLHFTLNQSAKLSIEASGHPIHIHVNPMLLDADPQRLNRGLPLGRYWADTIFGGASDKAVMPFDHWPGKSVVHCHILDHEDSGMMNVLEIRNGTGIPIFPVKGLLDITHVPASILAAIKPAWPSPPPSGTDASSGPVVYVFLPRPEDMTECVHCSAAVNAIAALRHDASLPPFRIVAITGPNVTSLDALAIAMDLDQSRDSISADPALEVFEGMGVLDGTPVEEKADGRYVIRVSRKPDGSIAHPSDIMHGLFVVAPNGFIVSANRGFRAHDDVDQTKADIRIAANVQTQLAKVKQALDALPPPVGSKSKIRDDALLNLKRFDARFDAFERARK